MFDFIIFTILIITAILFPYKKFIAWLRQYAKPSVLGAGLIMVIFPLVFSWLMPADNKSTPATIQGKSDLLTAAQSNAFDIVSVLVWVVLIAGIITIISAICIARGQHLAATQRKSK